MLWHAAAGGVGLIACQWVSSIGAKSSAPSAPRRRRISRNRMAARMDQLPDRRFRCAREGLTGGRGVDVVYDSVGKDTFPGRSMPQAVRALGELWQFIGPGAAFRNGHSRAKRFALRHAADAVTHIATRQGLLETANELIDMVSLGRVKIQVSKTYPMAEAAQAHRDLESRGTTGSIVLLADYAQSLPSAHGGGPDGFRRQPLTPALSRQGRGNVWSQPLVSTASLIPLREKGYGGMRGHTTINKCLPHKRRLRWTRVREASIAGRCNCL